jgi:hypothetical protein
MSSGVCDNYYPSKQSILVDCKCLIDGLGEVKKTPSVYLHCINDDDCSYNNGSDNDSNCYSKNMLISFI